MLRWNHVLDKEVYGLTVKMYREPCRALETISSPYKNLELDHQAFRFFESELYMYRILDTNFERYMEERGDLSRFEIVVPTIQDISNTVL
jgi:hypothetical protein